MNKRLKALKAEIEAAGCINFHIEGMPLPIPDCVHILFRKNAQWQVAFFERGKRGPVEFESTDLDAACDYFYALILREGCMRVLIHSRDKIRVDGLHEQLTSKRFYLMRNDIPAFSGPGDARYRIFVRGSEWKDILAQFPGLPHIEHEHTGFPGEHVTDA